MSLSVYNARLLDPASNTDQMGRLLVDRGKISAFEPGATDPHANAEESIDAGGLCLSPGLVDLRVKTGEPGDEQKETLASASAAALAGGITSMVIMPDTQPVIDDVALVRFIAERGHEDSEARIYPAGAMTVGLKGEQMAEIGLMKDAGAVMFSNGNHPVDNPSILKRIMSYAASRDATLFCRPDNHALKGAGVMNAGATASRMGLSGIPVEAEWIGAQRDATLAERTGASVIIDQVSTPRTLEIIAEAKARGARVSTTVAAHSLFFNELDVGDYLTYCKVNPPFRTEDDRQGLIMALKAGDIDAVVSAHDPQPPEEKRLPFGEASFGAAGLETVLATMLSLVHDGPLTVLEALRPLTSGPANLIGLPGGHLSEGAPADFILFDPDKPWHCQRENLSSLSTNSPYDGRRLTGKVKLTFVAGVRTFSDT